jgi:hypothetical protein
MADVVAKAVEQAPVVLASRAGSGTVLSHTYGFIGSEQDLLARGVIPAGWLDGRKARGADDGSRLAGILSSLRDNASAYVRTVPGSTPAAGAGRQRRARRTHTPLPQS